MIKVEDYRRLSQAHASAKESSDIFAAVESVIRERVGFGLLTMLMLSQDGEEVQRLYTTNPVDYPVSGRERLGKTAWGQHVFVEQRPFLGPDREALRWAFPADFDLIVSLDLGSTMNVPIVALGTTLGSLNILDAERRLTAEKLKAACSIAPFLSVPFLRQAGQL